MPRLTDATRAERRAHVLTSAWVCFSRNGYHQTSMDDVIAETGMSSSAVYRYFRSKDELIDASAEEGMTAVRDVFERAQAQDPLPGPEELIGVVVQALHRRAAHERYDLTRLAMSTWAEAVRSPHLQARAGMLYGESLTSIAAIMRVWQARGQVRSEVDVAGAAYVLSSLLHGLIVNHHLIGPVDSETVIGGLRALGLFLDGEAAAARPDAERLSIAGVRSPR